MKYWVQQFNNKGFRVSERFVKAKSFRAALNLLIPGWYDWKNALVVNGKGMARRYGKNSRGRIKLIRDIPRPFKTYFNSRHAIMFVIRNFVEFHKFQSEKERDEAYEKCLTFDLAEYVESDKEQSDTTASLGETSVSKSISTSKKILNGYAIPATCLEALIPSSIEESSGKDSAKDSEGEEWSRGSTASRSKPSPTFATVKPVVKVTNDYPGVTADMARMVGKTIKVHKVSSFKGMPIWQGGRFIWQESWLDFRKVTVTVMPSEDPEFYRMFRFYVGKNVKMLQCSDHFTVENDHLCIPTKFLAEPIKITRPLRGIFIGGKSIAHSPESPGLTFLSSMEKWVGKECHFKPYVPSLFKMIESNLIVHEKWIKFHEKEESLEKAWSKFATLPVSDKKWYEVGGS